MMWVKAVFPAREVRQREDGLADFIGVGYNGIRCDEFPWSGEVQIAVLLRRSEDDRVPRHELKVFRGDGAPGSEQIASMQFPGLESGRVGGVMGLGVPMQVEQPGVVQIAVQIDDGPIVTTEFEMRQA